VTKSPPPGGLFYLRQATPEQLSIDSGELEIVMPTNGRAQPASERRSSENTTFQIAIGAIIAVAALSVVIASLRMTDRAIDRAVAQREAANRFLAEELSTLRAVAVTSRSPVPGRLFLGMEECFRRGVALPFDTEDVAHGKRLIRECGEIEIGRLYAQGGGAMADEGRRILQETGVLK
jgi:hypothetical protein